MARPKSPDYEAKRKSVLDLKAQGMTYVQIGAALGMSPQMACRYGKPRPGERRCHCCSQSLR